MKIKKTLKAYILNHKSSSAGFTFIEAILYMALVTIMMSYIVPYAWNIIQGGAKSAVQEEVTSNARYISERIKYEIRNSFGINSVTSSQIVLCQTQGSCSTNPTTITYSTPNVTIQDDGAAAVNLNSSQARITSLVFTNNSSVDGSSENISFTMTVTTNYQGNRKDFIYTVDLSGGAEVRSN